MRATTCSTKLSSFAIKGNGTAGDTWRGTSLRSLFGKRSSFDSQHRLTVLCAVHARRLPTNAVAHSAICSKPIERASMVCLKRYRARACFCALATFASAAAVSTVVTLPPGACGVQPHNITAEHARVALVVTRVEACGGHCSGADILCALSQSCVRGGCTLCRAVAVVSTPLPFFGEVSCARPPLSRIVFPTGNHVCHRTVMHCSTTPSAGTAQNPLP